MILARRVARNSRISFPLSTRPGYGAERNVGVVCHYMATQALSPCARLWVQTYQTPMIHKETPVTDNNDVRVSVAAT